MTRHVVAALACALLVPLFVACNISTGSGTTSCDDTANAGPCTGTFPCGNSGIQGACDMATQVCVVKPGTVNCVDITGASASSCPSAADAVAVAGCTVATSEKCSGSSSEGITVNCD